MAATAVMMEVWRGYKFGIGSVTDTFETDRSHRHGTKLRTTRNPKSFTSMAAKLWNKTDLELSKSQTVTTAKTMVEDVVNQLPTF